MDQGAGGWVSSHIMTIMVMGGWVVVGHSYCDYDYRWGGGVVEHHTVYNFTNEQWFDRMV